MIRQFAICRRRGGARSALQSRPTLTRTTHPTSRDIEKTVPDHNAPLVLYCGGGFRSALAADNLQKMGYTNVISMDGGWRGWTESGFPVTKD